MKTTISVAKNKQNVSSGYNNKQVFFIAFCHDWIASSNPFGVLTLENNGIRTVNTDPDTMVAKGNWMKPLANSAKTTSPK